MAQGYDYNFDFFNEQWADVGPALNNYFKYLQSMNAGDTPPPSELAGMPWLDTSGDEPVPKFYDGSDWIEIDENTVIGEDVLLASGSKDSLADRLNVALNEDGTIKSDLAENMTEWIDSTLTATYVSADTFTVPGDYSDVFVTNRKIKATLDASSVYSAVESANYNSADDKTTIVLFDTVIDATIQKVEYGLVKAGPEGSNPENNLIDETTGDIYELKMIDGSLAMEVR